MTSVRQTLMPRTAVTALAAALAAGVLGAAVPAQASDTTAEIAAPAPDAPVARPSVELLILRENGAGSRSAAQKYIDKLIAVVAQVNGWPTAAGAYFTKRNKANTFIAEHKPEYGMLSFGAFIGLADKYKLEAIGTVTSKAGGGQYFVISKDEFGLEGCKGKKLASNHAKDAAFIDNLVFADAFDLKDFEVVPTRRAVQTIKAVIKGEAACALIDDAQLGFLADLEGGPMLRAVWSSVSFPAVVVVKFPSAAADQAKAMSANLSKICEVGKSACDAAGIESLQSAPASEFTAYLRSYSGL